jgi:hypothetical protein
MVTMRLVVHEPNRPLQSALIVIVKPDEPERLQAPRHGR